MFMTMYYVDTRAIIYNCDNDNLLDRKIKIFLMR